MKQTLSFYLLLFMCNFLQAQVSSIVINDSILYPVHRNNIGKITFMEKTIPIENYSEKDFLATYGLKDSSDLNIRVFLEKSLKNHLQSLSPNSDINELTSNGNYQFSFYID